MDEKRAQITAALTVAMALVPGLYSRNKMFGLFDDPTVRRARSRARLLRSIAKHLGGEVAPVAGLVVTVGARTSVRYGIPSVRLSRAVELTRLELAALRVLLARAGSCPAELGSSEDDRPLVDAALARLPEVRAGHDAV